MKRKGNRQKRKENSGDSWVRMIFISIIFGTGLFAFALGVEWIGASSTFRVEKIIWLGLQHLEADEMTERFQSLLGKNIFKIDLYEVHHRLLSEQWINTATVKKNFPNRLLIIVVERKPAALEFQLNKRSDALVDLSIVPVVIDTEGVILQEGGAFPPGLARLIHVNLEAYDQALGLWALMGNHPGLFINLLDPDDLLVYLTEEEEGKQVGLLHFGNGRYEDSWARFLTIEEDLKERGLAPWEIDLRFSGQLVVKTASESHTDLRYF